MLVTRWVTDVARAEALTTSSSTPVTVIDCAVLQLPVVKLSAGGVTVAMPVSPLWNATDTVSAGWVLSTTV